MNCAEVEVLLHGYLDGELDLLSSLEIERHLEECRARSQDHQDYRSLRSTISVGGLYFGAPAAWHGPSTTTNLPFGVAHENRQRLHPLWILAVGISVL
jgi:anti-sigma factor RsiW